MSGTSSNRILSIYKARNTILEFMDKLNYDISEYNTFSINEIDAMFINNQLDMLLKHSTNQQNVYIRYYFSDKTHTRQIRPQTLDTIIEDLYEIDNVLTKKDTLIIIIDEEPNDKIVQKMKYLYENNGIFVVIHNLKRLQYNLLNHALNPKVGILTEDAVEALKKKMNIATTKQLPEISRFDPLALAITLRPGQVASFERASPTSLVQHYYRICV